MQASVLNRNFGSESILACYGMFAGRLLIVQPEVTAIPYIMMQLYQEMKVTINIQSLPTPTHVA